MMLYYVYYAIRKFLEFPLNNIPQQSFLISMLKSISFF